MSAADKKKLDGVTTGAKAYYINYGTQTAISVTKDWSTWTTYKPSADGALKINTANNDGSVQHYEVRLTNSSGKVIAHGTRATQFNTLHGAIYVPLKSGTAIAIKSAANWDFYFCPRA